MSLTSPVTIRSRRPTSVRVFQLVAFQLVRLTPSGERKYQQILHLRPQYARKEGAVYTFTCTQRQVENYFFKFGHDARILAPQELADKFKRMYESAAEQYE